MVPTSTSESRAARGRHVRRGSLPSLSIVLISESDTVTARAKLGVLVEECNAAGAELVIARRGAPAELVTITRGYSTVRAVLAPPEASVAELRVLGFQEAAGDIVALVSDSASIATGWIQPLRASRPHPKGVTPIPAQAVGDDRTSE